MSFSFQYGRHRFLEEIRPNLSAAEQEVMLMTVAELVATMSEEEIRIFACELGRRLPYCHEAVLLSLLFEGQLALRAIMSMPGDDADV